MRHVFLCRIRAECGRYDGWGIQRRTFPLSIFKYNIRFDPGKAFVLACGWREANFPPPKGNDILSPQGLLSTIYQLRRPSAGAQALLGLDLTTNKVFNSDDRFRSLVWGCAVVVGSRWGKTRAIEGQYVGKECRRSSPGGFGWWIPFSTVG